MKCIRGRNYREELTILSVTNNKMQAKRACSLRRRPLTSVWEEGAAMTQPAAARNAAVTSLVPPQS